MNRVTVRRRRTGWDIALGILLILAGLFVLGNTVLATALSILFLGWLALISGLLALVSAVINLLSRQREGFWLPLLSGVVLTVLGLMFLRNAAAAALTVTLLAGALFLTSGITRVIAAFQTQRYRWLMLIGGGVSVILGLIVLFNLVEFSLTLLGVLLAVELLADGITLALQGRLHVDPA